MGRDPGITEPDIIVRPWLFLLLNEGCGHNSYNLEHPQGYTLTNQLSWHRHHDLGNLGLFVQVLSEGPVTHSYVLIMLIAGGGLLTGPGIKPRTSRMISMISEHSTTECSFLGQWSIDVKSAVTFLKWPLHGGRAEIENVKNDRPSDLLSALPPDVTSKMSLYFF